MSLHEAVAHCPYEVLVFHDTWVLERTLGLDDYKKAKQLPMLSSLAIVPIAAMDDLADATGTEDCSKEWDGPVYSECV